MTTRPAAPPQIHVVGCMPYKRNRPFFGDSTVEEFDRLIANIGGAARPERGDLLVHVGDAIDFVTSFDELHKDIRAVAATLDSSGLPWLFTPGDNEWVEFMDMHTGSSSAAGALLFLRNEFYSGSRELALRQSLRRYESQRLCPENQACLVGPAVVATLHIVWPGRYVTKRGLGWEFESRHAQVSNWVKKCLARAGNDKALILLTQAAPERPSGHDPDLAQLVDDLLKDIVGQVETSGVPTLYVHADRHTPANGIETDFWDFGPSSNFSTRGLVGKTAPNLFRIETPGGIDGKELHSLTLEVNYAREFKVAGWRKSTGGIRTP